MTSKKHEWTKPELALLKKLVKQEMPWKAIALRIGTVGPTQARHKAERLGWHRPHVKTKRVKFCVMIPAPIYEEWSRQVHQTGHTKARRFRILIREDVNRLVQGTEHP